LVFFICIYRNNRRDKRRSYRSAIPQGDLLASAIAPVTPDDLGKDVVSDLKMFQLGNDPLQFAMFKVRKLRFEPMRFHRVSPCCPKRYARELLSIL
jgi:hypothetical protein